MLKKVKKNFVRFSSIIATFFFLFIFTRTGNFIQRRIRLEGEFSLYKIYQFDSVYIPSSWSHLLFIARTRRIFSQSLGLCKQKFLEEFEEFQALSLENIFRLHVVCLARVPRKFRLDKFDEEFKIPNFSHFHFLLRSHHVHIISTRRWLGKIAQEIILVFWVSRMRFEFT